MAVASFSSLPRHNTLAEFAGAGGWAKLLSDALTTVGVVKTADTGQINFAGLGAAPAINTYAGYEIRRITMTGGQTYVIKIEYGTAGSAGVPQLRIQIARTTDGAGVLGSDPSTAFVLASSAAGGTAIDSNVSGDATRFGFFLWGAQTGSQVGVMFLVGRLKNTNGTDADTGINIVTRATAGTHSGVKQQYLPKTGPPYPTPPMSNVQCDFPPEGNMIMGVNAGAAPIVPNIGYSGNPTLEGLVYSRNDNTLSAQIQVIQYGVSHNYLCLNGLSGNMSVNGNANALFAIRYE